MNWYVIFVQYGQEQRVVEFLRRRLDPDMGRPFIPVGESLFKKGGNIVTEWKMLFPSYVFIESNMSDEEYLSYMNQLIYESCKILKLLKYSETEFALREPDKLMLIRLLNDKNCLEASVGIKVGKRIYIKSGPLKGMEGKIKKVNRHKRVAEIQLNIMGEIKEVIVTLEIVANQDYPLLQRICDE